MRSITKYSARDMVVCPAGASASHASASAALTGGACCRSARALRAPLVYRTEPSAPAANAAESRKDAFSVATSGIMRSSRRLARLRQQRATSVAASSMVRTMAAARQRGTSLCVGCRWWLGRPDEGDEQPRATRGAVRRSGAQNTPEAERGGSSSYLVQERCGLPCGAEFKNFNPRAFELCPALVPRRCAPRRRDARELSGSLSSLISSQVKKKVLKLKPLTLFPRYHR